MSRRAEIGVLVAVALIAVAIYRGYVRPAEERLDAGRRELAALQAEREQAIAAERELPRKRSEIEELRQRLDDLLAAVPERPDASRLLERLQSLSAAADVRLLSFSPQRLDEGELRESWSADVRLEGAYHGVAALLARIGDGSGFTDVGAFSIRAQDASPGAPAVVADVRVSAVLRPAAGAGADVFTTQETDASAEGVAPADVSVRRGRDPFVRVRQRGAEPGHAMAPRPDGLAGVSMADAVLRGTLQTPSGRVALLRAHDGRTYAVRPGDELLDGTVRAVSEDGLAVSPPDPPAARRAPREPSALLTATEEK